MKDNHTNETFRSKMHSLKHVRLSEHERATMKSQLLSYADMHEARERAGIPSPFSYKSLLVSSRVVFSATFALVLLVGSTGVSFAAQNTLPGQPLYAVKVNVTEPVESAVISVTSGKAGEAAWQNKLAERRLQEATVLADRDDLASSTQIYLAQQVAIHVDASQQDSAELAEAGATTTAQEANADLADKLSAHAKVLALLTSRLEDMGNASTSARVAVLLEKFNHGRGVVALEASSTVLALASSTDEGSLSAGQDSTNTPMLAINVENEGQIRANEVHTLHQELRTLKMAPVATTSTTTASSTQKTASSTDDQNESEHPFEKLLEFFQK